MGGTIGYAIVVLIVGRLLLLAATPVCALAIQPLWSTIADKLGRRRAVIVILCLAAAVLAPLYYLASTFSRSFS